MKMRKTIKLEDLERSCSKYFVPVMVFITLLFAFTIPIITYNLIFLKNCEAFTTLYEQNAEVYEILQDIAKYINADIEINKDKINSESSVLMKMVDIDKSVQAYAEEKGYNIDCAIDDYEQNIINIDICMLIENETYLIPASINIKYTDDLNFISEKSLYTSGEEYIKLIKEKMVIEAAKISAVICTSILIIVFITTFIVLKMKKKQKNS